MKHLHYTIALIIASIAVLSSTTTKVLAQDPIFLDDFNDIASLRDSLIIYDDTVADEPEPAAPKLMTPAELVKAVETADKAWLDSLSYRPLPIPESFFGPVVYTPYEILDDQSVFTRRGSNKATEWINREQQQAQDLKRIKQNYVVNNPRQVHYNESMLPEPPKQYRAVVDPRKNILVVEEVNVNKSQSNAIDSSVDIKRKNWIHSFNGSLQFSQAYVSPNWYQGGNNNLNMIANLVYNVKLNQTFHPNLMFETNVQYKLGMNNAPDDSLRNYSISEDLLQVISKFGVKAFKRWYYSVNLSFKTQLLHNYKKNTTTLSAAILSPGELNLGVGMTYNLSKSKCTFDASLSPLSYNIKTCINPHMDVTSFGIDAGRKSVSEMGSSAELKFTWQMAYNISYTSRMFIFTDYSYTQGDWENTINFSINKYLSTMLYVHIRYDSSTQSLADTNWHHWQAKEILSLGFSYTFKNS
jgi:hypothetical protein